MINKLEYYLQNKPTIDRLINELPASVDKGALQAKQERVLNTLKATVANPSEYEKAERQYKDLSAEIRYAKPHFIPQQAPVVKPVIPTVKKASVGRVAKDTSQKDREQIERSFKGREDALNRLADNPDITTAKSKLNTLKAEYEKIKNDPVALTGFMQNQFRAVDMEIGRTLVANRGNIKMPQQTQQKGPQGVSRFATPTVTPAPKAREMTPDEFLAAHPELADDPSMMESILKEGASRTLMKTISGKTGLPVAQLEQFWDIAVQKNSKLSETKDTAFWTGVMKEFQTLIDRVDIEEAKNIMETREKYKEAANSFLNNIAEDNYTAAQESFKTMVDARLTDNISKRAEAYCQNVLSQEAKKLSKDL